MRPKPFSVGTLAYLVLVFACWQPMPAQVQAPLVTRASPLTDPSLPPPQSGQRARLSDQEPIPGVQTGAAVDRGPNDQAWTSPTPRPLPSAGSLPPLPSASLPPSVSLPPSAAAQPNRAGGQSSNQLPPVTGAVHVMPAQYTGSEAQQPASMRSSSGKPVSLASAQTSLNDLQPDSNSTTRPLKPRSQTSDATSSSGRSTSTVQMVVSVISSLLIVVALLLGAAWCYRKAAPSINGTLPKDAVHMLGRTAIAPRQQLMIIRFGSKLLLVSNLQGEVRTLSEIDDPLEVDRIAGLCESAQAGSISHSFRTVLHNLGGTSE